MSLKIYLESHSATDSLVDCEDDAERPSFGGVCTRRSVAYGCSEQCLLACVNRLRQPGKIYK